MRRGSSSVARWTRQVVIGIALLGVVVAWGRLDWSRRIGEQRRVLQGFSQGLTGSLTLAMQGAVTSDGIDASAVGAILERAVELRAPELRCAALVVDGRVVARGGREMALPPLKGLGGAGQAVVEDTLFIWRPTSRESGNRVPDRTMPREHRPPPKPHELTDGPLPRPGWEDRIGGVVLLGYPRSFEGEALRRELGELGLRMGLVLLTGLAILVAFELGRRNQRHASDLQAERARSQTLAEVGLTAAGLAHETKNPLGIIIGLAQQVSRDAAVPAEHRARAEQIIDAADRAAARLGEFIHYARTREPRVGTVDLRALVRSTLDVLEPEAEAAGVDLEMEVHVEGVKADEDMLRQVLLNLVLNGLQASDPGGHVLVRATREAGGARLEVSDRGRGIEPALLPDVFQPYVTGRPDGNGLGLAIVRRIAQLHGWTADIASAPGQGTRVWLHGLEATT